jgi:hypothetical protein
MPTNEQGEMRAESEQQQSSSCRDQFRPPAGRGLFDLHEKAEQFPLNTGNELIISKKKHGILAGNVRWRFADQYS